MGTVTPLQTPRFELFDRYTALCATVMADMPVLQGVNVASYSGALILIFGPLRIMVQRFNSGVYLWLGPAASGQKHWWEGRCMEIAALPSFFERQRRELPTALQDSGYEVNALLLNPALVVLCQIEMALHRMLAGPVPGIDDATTPALQVYSAPMDADTKQDGKVVLLELFRQ